jgi:hypothetical protein
MEPIDPRPTSSARSEIAVSLGEVTRARRSSMRILIRPQASPGKSSRKPLFIGTGDTFRQATAWDGF